MLERGYRHIAVLLDELALEPDDNPGTTMGTFFSIAHNCFSPSWSDVAFDHPTRRNKPCSSHSLPEDRTASVSSRICTVTKSSKS